MRATVRSGFHRTLVRVVMLCAVLVSGQVQAQIGTECPDPSAVYASAAMTAPAQGADFYPAAQSVTLSAIADAFGATVSGIELRTGGGALIGTIADGGSLVWNGLGAGTYSVYATPIATSQFAWCTVNIYPSALLTFIVSPYTPSVVTVGATGNGTAAPATINLSTTISGRNPIYYVDYLANGSQVAANPTPPHNATWSNVWPGTFSMVARAWDIYGGISQSPAVQVVIAPNPPPAVNLTVTSNTGTAPATVVLDATATDPLGITSVEFHAGGVLLGTDTAAPYTYTWTNVTAGTYNVIARAVNGYGTVGDSAPRTVTVSAVAPPDPNNPPNSGGPVGGSLPGSVAVSATGAATYSIPITVPPGTAGMVPALSLDYSSQSAAGLMGVGWSVNGLSTITRCAQTVAQDGVRRGIELNANDRYCLDGQRLILVSGTYGATAEYRTELETFSQVKSFGSNSAVGPDRWEVRTKAGMLMHYGNTSDSLVEAQGTSPTVYLKWALSRVQDRKGNYWTVSYDENTAEGEHYPRQISYSGNSSIATPLVPYAAVRFVYQLNRPDPEIEYVAGAKISTLRRLSKVQTLLNIAADGSGGSLVRDLRVGYAQAAQSGRSLVDSIQDCNSSGVCLPATSFTWQHHVDSERHFNAPGSGVWGGPVAVYDPATVFLGWQPKKNIFYSIAMVDLNGDGKTDMLKTLENGIWQACLSTGSGFNCQNWPGPALKLKDVILGDFNGDSRIDILHAGPQGTPLQACLSTGTGFNCIPWPGIASPPGGTLSGHGSLLGDFNGDGRDDLDFCYSTGSGFNCMPMTIYPWGGSIVEQNAACPDEQRQRRNIPGDYNGDGRLDYLVIEQWSPACKPPQFSHNYTYELFITTDDGSTRGWVRTGPAAGIPNVDVNSGHVWTGIGTNQAMTNTDAYPDLVLQGLTGGVLRVCRTTGRGFACHTPATDSGQFDSVVLTAADFDGDGRSDTLHYVSTNVARVCQINGNGTYPCSNWSAPTRPEFGNGIIGLVYGDFNGDGKTDLATYNENTQQWSIALAGGARPDLLSQVRNGVGHVTQMTFKPLSDNSVYTRDSNAAHPQRDVQDPTPVVSQVRVANGLGGWLTTDYRYGGMKFDLAGRGPLGMRWMEATEQVARVTTRTEYAQNWPYVGLAQRVIATHVSAVALSRTENTLAIKSGCSSSGQLSYVSSTVKTLKDLNGASISTTTTGTQIDCFGNPTQATETIVAGGETYSTSAVNTFDNVTATWRIGELRCARVTKTAPGVSNVLRTVGIDYDSMGLVLRETVEPRSGTPACSTTDTGYQYEVKAESTRDVYGNLATKTVRWREGSTDRSRQTEVNTYDARGRFATTVKNALNHTETRAYSEAHGTVTSLTGPNGLTTTWNYDSWGRRTRETRADTSFTSWSYNQCQTGCNGATMASIVTPSNGVPTVTYVDALGRDLRDQTWSFNGTAIVADREYDALGRLSRVAIPRFSNQSPEWTTYTRDDLGRAWRTTTPDGMTTVTFNGLEISSVNPKNQSRREIRNGLGKMRQVFDHNNRPVTYRYEPWGNLQRTTDSLGNNVVMTYDRLGRKVGLTDPDLGYWTYVYNPIGELLEQVDPVRRALSQKTSFTYDALGRMTSRVEPDATSTWTYDSCTKGLGKLCQASGANAYLRRLTYDALGRTSTVSINLDGTYISSYSYNAQGRVSGSTHRRAPLNGTTGPSQAFTYIYNSLGFLREVKSGSGASYWLVEERDALHRVTRELAGNGVRTRRTYDARTTRLNNIMAGPNETATVQNDAYAYDSVGNLSSRSFLDSAGGLRTETFLYDQLNRVTSSTINGATKSYGYNELGNLTSKTGVGNYTYPSSGGSSVRPHAVTSIAGTLNGVTNPTFSYNANGNLLSGAGRSWSWNAGNLPVTITQGSLSTQFIYGPERQRTKQTLLTSGSPTKTIFYAGAMQKEIAGSTTTVRTYLPNDIGVITEVSSPASTQVRYFHRDRLGSLTTITNSSGAVVERLSYDPWGRRRNANGTDAANLTSAITDDPGYTGHEMLDDFALVHMNGRVYDPALARVVSADPLVSDAHDLQGFNRYAYVANNPLVYTDPSGFRATPPGCYMAAEGSGCSTAEVLKFATQSLEAVVVTARQQMSEYVKAGVRVINCGGQCSLMAGGALSTTMAARLPRSVPQLSLPSRSAILSGIRASPWALLIMPSDLADGTLSPEMRAFISQSTANSDNGQDAGEALGADSSGAKDAPITTTDRPSREWIYGPENDPKINPDGSTKPNTWTSPDSYPDRETAVDKLDPFKPVDGRRPVTVPEGTGVKRGRTPGHEGPYNGRGGGRETLIPGGLPPGSVGPWEPLR